MPDNPVNLSDSGPTGPEHTVTSSVGSIRTTEPLTIGPGSVLDGRYQMEAVLGQGGSGTVFRAWDRVLGEPIAIKILHPERAREKSWIKRLAREVRVARAIRHPNVCRVFDLGQASGNSFVTMELATGGSLRDLLREGKPRALADRLTDARAVCAGLAAIHAVGIIHRDVTPQNVLRMQDSRLILSDFGLAIETSDETTVHGGTPNYMAPETVMGERSDQRSDVWQLGAILHEIMFGRRPEWNRSADGVAMKWPLPPDASPVEEEVARLCGDCLAQNPAARPATAMAVAGRLAAAEVARPRTPVARAWVRARSLVRHHRGAAVGIAAALVLGVVVRAVQIASRPPLCRAAGSKTEEAWDMRTKARVRQAFEKTGKAYALATFWGVNRSLERYLDDWGKMYTEACEATNVRGEQSSEVLDLRMSCLQDRLSGVKALSQMFGNATSDMVDNAMDAVGALGTLELCGDARLLRAMLPPPEDPAKHREVERIRRGVIEARVLHDAGEETRAAQRLRKLIVDSRVVAYPPVLAEALQLLGHVQPAEDNAAAENALKEAFFQAEASRHDEVKAFAAAELVFVTGRQERYAEAEEWARHAASTLDRIGGHDRLRAWLETDIGALRNWQGRKEEAIQHQQRAIELKQRSGAGMVDIARNLNNVAVNLNDLGRPQEALEQIQRAILGLTQEVGAGHPLVATYISNEGEILAALGRHDEARASFLRGIASEERSFGRDSTNLAHPLHGLGESYLAQRKPGAAIAPLERAFRIRDAHETDQSLVADSAFALARALWESGKDRPRARTLADKARGIYLERPAFKTRLAEVDSWLSAAKP